MLHFNFYSTQKNKISRGIVILWVLVVLATLLSLVIAFSDVIWSQFQTEKTQTGDMVAQLQALQGISCASYVDKRTYSGFISGSTPTILKQALFLFSDGTRLFCAKSPVKLKTVATCPSKIKEDLDKTEPYNGSGTAPSPVCKYFILPNDTSASSITYPQPCAAVWVYNYPADEGVSRTFSHIESYGYSQCEVGTNAETGNLVVKKGVSVRVLSKDTQ